jgi:hypothetical protein
MAQGCADEDCAEIYEAVVAPDDPPEHKRLEAEGY